MLINSPFYSVKSFCHILPEISPFIYLFFFNLITKDNGILLTILVNIHIYVVTKSLSYLNDQQTFYHDVEILNFIIYIIFFVGLR